MTLSDLDELRNRVEELRAEMKRGPLDERRVWLVMQHASSLLERAEGSPLEATVRNIFVLVSAVWRNTQNQSKLRAMRRALT